MLYVVYNKVIILIVVYLKRLSYVRLESWGTVNAITRNIMSTK